MATQSDFAIKPALHCFQKLTNLMNIPRFVGGSSAILLAWLAATYLHEVPPERYPKQDRTIGATTTTPAISDQATTDLAASDH